MKSRISYGLFLAVLMLVAFPSQEAFAQLGFISGEVVDEDGKPVKDATVRIEGMTGSRKYTLKTNSNGQYVHAGVSIQGIYRIVIEKEGFEGDYVQGVKPGFTRDEERSVKNFTLKRGTPRQMAFEMTDEELEALKEQQEEAKALAERIEAVRETFNQGVTFYNGGQYEEAIKAFEVVLEADNEQPSVWANVGACYTKLEQYDKAVEAYEHAIALEPDNATHYQSMGSAHAGGGNGEKAREYYEKAASMSTELSPADAAVNYYNMGVTYINAGQSQEAADALKEAVELDPNHAEAHYQLGITLISLNDMEGAMDHLKTYLVLAPTGPNVEVAKALIEQLG
ncbi:MAG TPA: tetratricopeptide repeat protein [Acidobacteriota bacterium]|nr:tetratricopeptide repeat protein [Acidobacteriota bacterium]